MALTVRNLYKESVKYHMKPLAGESGFGNLVQWVHIIETIESVRFLHGQELVITECIQGNDEDRLLTFVKELHARNASALIVNIGMYIEEIPESVIAFCKEAGFPLFVIPWEVPLVDVTREYCQRIIENAAKEDNIATTIKNLIFHTGDQDAMLHQMERFGFIESSEMLFLCIDLDREKGTETYAKESLRLKLLVESVAKGIKEQYISFEYQEKRVVILVDYTKEEADEYIDRVFKKLSAEKMLSDAYIGVGDSVKGLGNQEANFQHAFAACEIARRRREHILEYGELGLYQLLVNVENKEILTDFYRDFFGRLIEYDNENGTDYHRFLKTYVECDGHPGDVSDRFFIHRNTVNNYIKKIEEILGIDLFTWEGKAKLYAAYCIEDLL